MSALQCQCWCRFETCSAHHLNITKKIPSKRQQAAHISQGNVNCTGNVNPPSLTCAVHVLLLLASPLQSLSTGQANLSALVTITLQAALPTPA
jgi:hypothetical protein